MLKLKLQLLTTMCLFASFFNAFAQTYSSENKKAVKLFEDALTLIDFNRDLDRGMFTLSKVLQMDPDFTEANKKAADVFYVYMRDTEKAKKYYSKVVELAPNDAKYVTSYLNLANIYFKEMNHTEAKSLYEKVISFPYASETVTEEAQLMLRNVEFSLFAQQNAFAFEPKMLPRETINMFKVQSNPVLTADQSELIYSMRLVRGGMIDENIVISKKQADGTWGRPDHISKNINTLNNSEGAATISGDGKTLVFTTCNRKDGVGGCDLYYSTKKGEEWSVPENFGTPVNSVSWESNPSISADGKTLYFSSDRIGGMGGKDLWVTHFVDGAWLAPENLGGVINTKKHEVTPFIHADNSHLYFASDGYMGMGGYDVYYATKYGDEWVTPQNIGYPINTPENEGAIYVTPDFSKGYFEKYTAKGVDSHSELYEFDFPEEIRAEHKSLYSKGVIYDDVTKAVIEAEIELIDLETGKTAQRVSSDSVDGSYLVVLTEGHEYALHVKKEGYFFHSLHFDYRIGVFNPMVLDVYLKPLTKKEPITLSNIFFESGKYELQPKSFVELDRFVELLQQHQELKLEISGHTDNVGSEAANKVLSQNRAKAVYSYLLSKGLVSSRFTYKGYGSVHPVGDNGNEEGRAKNRRIEFKLL